MMHALDTKIQHRAFMSAMLPPARPQNHRYSTAASKAAATAPIATKQQHSPHPRCRQLHAATQQQAESSDYIQDSPDLMPHVLLTLESTWLNICSNSNNNSTNLDPSEQQQEEQQQYVETYLVPRTSVRLHHVSLPGFLSRSRTTEDLMISTWKQQTAQAWHTAVARAQQQQQRSSQQQCTSSQSSAADSWLQQTVHSGQHHWGPTAAVLQACGQRLNLNQLLYITDTLVDMITAAAESGSSGYDMYSSSSSKQTSGMFQLSMIALEQPAPARTNNRSQSTAAALQHLPSSSSSSSGSTEVVGRSKPGGVTLECAAVLPQLTALLLQQLQQQTDQQQHQSKQQQQTEQQQQQELDQNAQHEPPNQSRAVQLLQQIGQLHNMKNLGNADTDLISELLQQHISLQQCNLHDLAAVISCAGQLNQPLRASWLKGFVAAAVNKVQQQQQDGQVVASDVALLLDGLSLYPGPHIQNQYLSSSFLYCCQSQLPDLTPLQLSQLLTATASLNLNPNTMWLEAAAAAVQRKFPDCGFQDLVLLLQGMTAAAAAAAQDDEYVLDDLWWQSWFEASANRFAAVSLAAAAAGLQDNSSSSSMVGSALTYSVGAGSSSTSSNAQDPDAFAGFDLFEQSSVDTVAAAAANANPRQQQQQQRQVVSCNALFDALYVLVQVQREVHPLWLAGALEAYQRSCYNAGSTPQLLLLVSHLVDSPQSFAVRHRALMHHLMQPLQHKLAELNPEQLAQAVEVCVTYNLNLGVEWFRWHSAAILRLNTTFPLQPLARIANSYARLQITPDDFRLQQLFKSISWRLERQQRKQKAQERLERVRATITFKNEQRRRQNLRDKEALEKKKLKWQQRDAQKWGVGGTGMPAAAGPGPEGKAHWRKRKLKPPGTLDKKY